MNNLEPPQGKKKNPQRKLLSASRDSTWAIANISKVVGLVIAVNEMIIRDGEIRQSVLAFCGLLVLGSQATEDLILHTIDRIFSRELD
jgi:hypothetical protein